MSTSSASADIPSIPSVPADGLQRVDGTNRPRAGILLDLVRGLSMSSSSGDVLRSFASGMEKLRGPSGYISLSTRDCPPGRYRITRRIYGSIAREMHQADPWSELHRIPAMEGGLLGDIVRGEMPVIAGNLQVIDDPVLGDDLAKYRSLAAIPLYDQGEVRNWAIQLREAPDAFTLDDVEEAILRGNLVGTTVKSVRAAAELKRAQRIINGEMERIANIQRALLPKQMPAIPGVHIATSYEVHNRAGGDYYDFLALDEGRWLIVISDASGHGPAAAVLMAILQTLLHAYPRDDRSPARIAEHVNHHLARKGIEGSFTTAIFGVLNPADRSFTWIRAGHPPALIKDPGAESPVRRLDEVGELPLGILPDVRYTEATITLVPGQTLVLYTDGVIDALNHEDRLFGVEGIEDALHHCTGDPTCVMSSVGTALRDHEQDVRPSDDQTIVAIRVE